MPETSRRSPLRKLIVPAIATAAVFALLCSLGMWQVRRLHWKEALIAQVDSRLKEAPVPAPGPDRWKSLDLTEADYTPVTVSGEFLHDAEAHLYNSLMEPRGPVGGVGWFVFTPLRTDEGWIVYVNRGFVPVEKEQASTRPAGQVPGRVTVTGLLRRPETPGRFQASAKETSQQWFARQPDKFAARAGLPADKVAPYTIDADATPNPGGLPQGGETTVTFSNNHLQYVVTWFGLALALVGVFIAYARGVMKRRD
ncbi:MAG TPA: SURF1 family protein [Kaistia sp.]|jgi:surfeit locus 1 family protein|nr:SURF1 family protein [Kaistia sp.]